jgi:hypothetical protein
VPGVIDHRRDLSAEIDGIGDDPFLVGLDVQHTGNQSLRSQIALDQVGIVLGLEMSRLARSCKDWHHLLAAKLNAEGFRTAKGLAFDDKAVGYVARTRGWGRGRGKHGERSKE